MNRAWLKAGVCAFLGAVLLVQTGCLWPPKGPKGSGELPTGDDGLGFSQLDSGSEYGLAERTALGVPVSDRQFDSVLFGYDKYRIEPVQQAKIDAVGSFMLEDQSVICVTEGHADERGSREYNFSLGELRALAVRNYLISFGVAPDRIQTRSYGEEMPMAMGHDESAWRQNRRVDFSLYRP